jgi:hypothetical protein
MQPHIEAPRDKKKKQPGMLEMLGLKKRAPEPELRRNPRYPMRYMPGPRTRVPTEAAASRQYRRVPELGRPLMTREQMRAASQEAYLEGVRRAAYTEAMMRQEAASQAMLSRPKKKGRLMQILEGEADQFMHAGSR